MPHSLPETRRSALIWWGGPPGGCPLGRAQNRARLFAVTYRAGPRGHPVRERSRERFSPRSVRHPPKIAPPTRIPFCAILLDVLEVDPLPLLPSLVVGSQISFLTNEKMKSFSELTLSPVLQANLLKHGFTQPT